MKCIIKKEQLFEFIYCSYKQMAYSTTECQKCLLNSYLNGTILIGRPPGFINPKLLNHVCHLKHYLYGLKQAVRAWWTTFNIPHSLDFSVVRLIHPFSYWNPLMEYFNAYMCWWYNCVGFNQDVITYLINFSISSFRFFRSNLKFFKLTKIFKQCSLGSSSL